MPRSRQVQIGEDLGRIFAGQPTLPTDRALLDGFVAARDSAAFGAIMERHGAMVRGVCRRILRDGPDADDAFQATFLVLLTGAGRIKDADLLAPWLFGVATRVALKARARSARSARRGNLPEDAAAAVPCPGRSLDLIDVLPLVDAEIARLPAKLRAAVVLCLVEGVSPAEAAARLDCPVNTVKSRLARGRDALRVRLGRRGIAPTLALAALDQVAPAPVTAALAHLAHAATLAPTLTPTLLALTRGVAPAIITKSAAVATLLLGGVVLVGGEVAVLRSQSDAQAGAQPLALEAGQTPPVRPGANPVGSGQAGGSTLDDPPPSTPSIAQYAARRYAEIVAREQAERRTMEQAAIQNLASNPTDQPVIWAEIGFHDALYSKMMLDLANSIPTDPVARDALLWVINKPNRPDIGAYGDHFARAAALLVRHFGDDPIAVSAAMGKGNVLSAHRDALLFGFLASAKSHDAQGMARLALAQYLARKADFAAAALKNPDFGRTTRQQVAFKDGTTQDVERERSAEERAYILSLRFCDPAALRVEAERLYRDVAANYADVHSINAGNRKQAALLRQPTPTRDGKPLTQAEIDAIRGDLARSETLAAIAEARLDEMQALAVGQPAPAIDGVNLDGQPMTLADHRGKVVVLTFWGSWCGPSLDAIRAERALVERFRNRPFALLGVDCVDDPEAARKFVAAERITWPSWHDGNTGANGPIARSYHLSGYPSFVLIDAEGIIRFKGRSLNGVDRAVERMLNAMKPPAAPN